MAGPWQVAVAVTAAASVLVGCTSGEGSQAAESPAEQATIDSSPPASVAADDASTGATSTTATTTTTPDSSTATAASASTSPPVTPPAIDDLAIGDDLATRLELKPIRFVRALREPELSEVEQVRLFLLANPTVELDIRVHLASFGPGTTAENDLFITEINARQIFLYLNNHDIDENRFQVSGRGRSELVIVPADPDGQQTIEEYEANNRVEFLVTAL